MPAPMMIIERPWDSSEFVANSRAMRMHCLGRHAGDLRLPGRGVGRGASSYPVGHSPAGPAAATPYWASIRSRTVVTRWPPTRRAGTPRRRTEPVAVGLDEGRQQHLDRLAVAGARSESAGVTPSRSRFHRPSPESA